MHLGALPAVAVVAVAVAIAPPRAQAQLRAEFAAACAAIDAIDYGEFACGRYGLVWDVDAPAFPELAGLGERPTSVEELAALLRDADPKVRTLAALLAFDREDKQLLPRIAALLGDRAPTFAAATRQPSAAMPQPVPRSRWKNQPATVSAVAEQLLGFVHWIADPRGGPDPQRAFDAFWKEHGKPEANAVWLRMRLWRARGGSTPASAACHERIARVRAAVDRLPSPDRELLTIGLPEVTFHPTECFATDDERIAAAKKLGDEVLLLCLAGEFPSADPGLRTLFCKDGVFGHVSSLHRFVLSPQRSIFAPAAANGLLALETEQRRCAEKNGTGLVDAGWVTTAASLQPQHATAWLVPALERFTQTWEARQRAELLAALVQFGDAASEAIVVQRFWRDDLAGMLGPFERAEVLAALPRVPRDKAMRVFRALLAAPAGAEIDPQTAVECDVAAGALLGARPVGGDAVRAVRHPFGLHRLTSKDDRDRASTMHPAETERVFATARTWRDKIVKALQ